MIPQINIITVVDVVGALSSDSLEENLFMMDNSRSRLTTGQGTDKLCTGVTFTQVLNWHIWAIDVQVDLLPHGIRWFDSSKKPLSEEKSPCAKSKLYGAPSGSYWAAIVKLQEQIGEGRYYYQLGLEVNNRQEWWTNGFPSILIAKTIKPRPLVTG